MVAFAVVYDACVLYPSIVRDMLIRVAIEGTVRAHWSEQILDEVFRNLKNNRGDLDPKKLERTRSLMSVALEDANVAGYESLIEGLVLPDPDDRHVLAAAIRAGVQLIVTLNLKGPNARHACLARIHQRVQAAISRRYFEADGFSVPRGSPSTAVRCPASSASCSRICCAAIFAARAAPVPWPVDDPVSPLSTEVPTMSPVAPSPDPDAGQ